MSLFIELTYSLCMAVSNSKHSNIPIFIPELACPHQCVFCNQAKISGAQNVPPPEDVPSIVEAYLSTMNDGREIEIAFFGGSFTGIQVDLQREYLKAAYHYKKEGLVSGIRLSTRPDYISEEIVELLLEFGVTAVELGAQSTNDEVLVASGRGHNFSHLKNAAGLIRKSGISLGLQMMVGLPADSKERSLQTARDIVNLGADNTRIYPTLVIKGTALERLMNQGKYLPLSLDEAVETSKEILKVFNNAGVKVLRIGLHQSDELSPEKSLAAGPYHRSFSELVQTELWYDLLKEQLGGYKGNVEVLVNGSQVNFVYGYEGKNRKRLAADGVFIKVSGRSDLGKYETRISAG